MSSWIKGIIVGGFIGVGITALIVSASHDEDPKNGWAWIDVVSHIMAGLSDRTDEIAYRSMPLDTSRSLSLW